MCHIICESCNRSRFVDCEWSVEFEKWIGCNEVRFHRFCNSCKNYKIPPSEYRRMHKLEEGVEVATKPNKPSFFEKLLRKEYTPVPLNEVVVVQGDI